MNLFEEAEKYPVCRTASKSHLDVGRVGTQGTTSRGKLEAAPCKKASSCLFTFGSVSSRLSANLLLLALAHLFTFLSGISILAIIESTIH
jgi:hypothetical protein